LAPHGEVLRADQDITMSASASAAVSEKPSLFADWGRCCWSPPVQGGAGCLHEVHPVFQASRGWE